MRDTEIVERAIRETIRKVQDHMPSGREQSLTLTKLEEALLWSKAGDVV